MKKRIIWSNVNINPEDWKESYKEIAELNEWDEDIEDEDILWSYINETLAQYLDDERADLRSATTERRIIAFADLGLWNGRRQGYRILGFDASEIFNINEDYNEYYSDGYNIRANCVHHDGTNRILFRVMRNDKDPDLLLGKIRRGEEVTEKQIYYYTKSLLPYVRKVYGW